MRDEISRPGETTAKKVSLGRQRRKDAEKGRFQVFSIANRQSQIDNSNKVSQEVLGEETGPRIEWG